MGDAAEAWLSIRADAVDENTWQTNRTAIRHLVEWCTRTRLVEEISVGDVQGLFSDLLREGYAVTTLDQYRRYLGAFFKWYGWGHIIHGDPKAKKGTPEQLGVVLPKVAVEDARAWTDVEIGQLREAADIVDENPRAGAPSARRAIELALATGLRRQELAALDWRAIDAGAQTLRATRQAVQGRHELKPLKGRLARTVLVLPEWWDHYRADGRGFVLSKNGDLPYTAVRPLLERVLDTARLNGRGLGWHTMRHTYARRFIELGGRFEELQKSLGHSSIRITENTYGHFADDVAAKLAGARIYGKGWLKVV